MFIAVTFSAKSNLCAGQHRIPPKQWCPCLCVMHTNDAEKRWLTLTRRELGANPFQCRHLPCHLLQREKYGSHPEKRLEVQGSLQLRLEGCPYNNIESGTPPPPSDHGARAHACVMQVEPCEKHGLP
jgi:hypothetical protein